MFSSTLLKNTLGGDPSSRTPVNNILGVSEANLFGDEGVSNIGQLFRIRSTSANDVFKLYSSRVASPTIDLKILRTIRKHRS